MFQWFSVTMRDRTWKLLAKRNSLLFSLLFIHWMAGTAQSYILLFIIYNSCSNGDWKKEEKLLVLIKDFFSKTRTDWILNRDWWWQEWELETLFSESGREIEVLLSWLSEREDGSCESESGDEEEELWTSQFISAFFGNCCGLNWVRNPLQSKQLNWSLFIHCWITHN